MGKWKNGKKTDYMLKYQSVEYWQNSLRGNGLKNVKSRISTKLLYLYRLEEFNQWLKGKSFGIKVAIIKNNQMIHERAQKTFDNVEKLLDFGEEENGNNKQVKKIISIYLDDPKHEHLSSSSMDNICSAIKSYFKLHEVEINLKFNGRKREKTEVEDDPELTRFEFYKMLTYSKIDHLVRAVMLVKFQAGLDSSTLADRFNFHAYPQISKFCGTTNYKEWSLDKCPIPIELIRVKTAVRHITFIDRDALSAIKDYLSWRESSRGEHDIKGPIFYTSRDEPISTTWIGNTFKKLAEYSQVQKKIAPRKNKITSHEVCDLLKTTLIVRGVPESIADIIIGHKPNDTYVKIGKLYPEKLREEYSKASRMLNIFSEVENMIKNPEQYDVRDEQLKAWNNEKERLQKENNELKAEKNNKIGKKVDWLTGIMMDVVDNMPDSDFKNNIKKNKK